MYITAHGPPVAIKTKKLMAQGVALCVYIYIYIKARCVSLREHLELEFPCPCEGISREILSQGSRGTEAGKGVCMLKEDCAQSGRNLPA